MYGDDFRDIPDIKGGCEEMIADPIATIYATIDN